MMIESNYHSNDVLTKHSGETHKINKHFLGYCAIMRRFASSIFQNSFIDIMWM
jgi:hypothetical protein